VYNRIIGLIGPTGSGKSYMAAQMMSSSERCAVYQLKRIHEEPAFVMVADDVVDGDIAEFAMKLGEPKFRYVYLCMPPDTEGKRLVVADLDTFIQACYIRERMTMIIDEAHFFCDPWHIPVFFRQAVVMGRSRFLDTIYCAQKFSTISKELTANTHELYIWRITEPGDLRSIALRCGDDCANAVANLRPPVDNRRTDGTFTPGEYVHWSNTGVWEVVDPWTPPSSSQSGESSSSPESQQLDTSHEEQNDEVDTSEQDGRPETEGLSGDEDAVGSS
jgi:hypothetical protein